MTFSALRCLLGICASTLLFTVSGAAVAQTYPSKPIRWVVPYPPGGGGDIAARLIAQKLPDVLGQPVLIENLSGAAGTLGTNAVAKAVPDGYTIGFGTNSTHAIVASLYAKLPYHPGKDFAPVANLVTVTNVLVVHPSVPARSVAELVEYARKNPGRLAYASAGNGSNAHLGMELFKSMTNTDILHVPYKGIGQALIDLLDGRVQIMVSNVPPVGEHIKAGKLRALATTGKARAPFMSDIPTVDESGIPGYESDAWWAAFAPVGTPAPVIERLNAAFLKVIDMADVRVKLREMGLVPSGGTPAELGQVVAADIARWAKVVEKSGARSE
ncbi:MAG: Bug family tripartite tricarboxylate transporter substrate binding protein [Burkholderiaceae bacterium]